MNDSEKTKTELIEELQVLRRENIHLREKAELRQREEKFRAIFDLSPDPIFLASVNTGHIVDANDAAAKLLKCPLDQIIGMHYTKLHPEDQLAYAQQAFAHRPVPGQNPPPVEIDIVCADQSLTPVEIRGRVIDLAGGEHIIGTFRDISERKWAEAKLEQNRRELRALLDTAADSMLLIKPDGEIIECNQTVANRFDRRREALIGSNSYVLVSPEVAKYRRGKAEAVIETGQPVQFEDARFGRIIKNVINPVLNADGEVESLAIFGADITEQREAETTVLESAKKYRVLFETIPMGLTVSDEAGNILETNPFAEKLAFIAKTDHEQRALTGPEWRFIRPDGTPMPEEEYASVRALKENRLVKNVEMGIVRGDDDIIWLNVTAAPIPLDNYGVVVAYDDITAKVQADEGLRATNRDLERAQQLARLGSWTWDLNTNTSVWSSGLYQIYGRDPALGTPDIDSWLDNIYPDDRIPLQQAIQQTLEGNKPYAVEYRILRYDSGEVRTLYAEGELAHDLSGTPSHLLGIAQDITERKMAEDALRESEERFRLLVEVAPMSILLMRRGRYVYANPTGLQMLGYAKPSEIEGLDVLQTIAPEYHAATKKRVSRIEQGQNNLPMEMKIISADGQTIHTLSASVSVELDGEPTAVIVAQDITQLKQAEAELSLHSQILMNIAEGVHLVRVDDGKIIFANTGLERMFGYEQGELLGQHVSMLNVQTALDPTETAAGIMRELNETGVWRGDIRNIKKDGTLFWCAAVVTTFNHPHRGPMWISVHQDITERKLAEDALRQKELEYRTIADFTYDWETWENPDGTFRYVSPAVKRITGYTEAEFVQDPKLMQAVILPEDRHVWEQHRHRMTKPGLKERIEFGIRRKDGEIRWIEHACQTVFDEQGNFLGFRSSNRNFTERKLAEEALRQSEHQYRTLFEKANDAIYLAETATGRILDCNQQAARMLGFSVDELKQKYVPDFHPSEEAERAAAEFEQVLQSSLGRMMVGFHHCHRDGTRVPVEINASLITLDSQTVILGIVRDISERVEGERLLRESAQRLAIATQSANLGIWDWGILGNTLMWDTLNFELYQVRPETFEGKYDDWARCIHPDDLPAAGETVQAAMAGEKDFHHQFRIIWPSGEVRTLEAHAVVQRAGDGTPLRMIGVNWDITDKVKLAEEHEQLQKQFYQSQKMESLGLLAGGMAHDFNNLLVPIVGFAELGVMMTPEDHKLHDYLTQIKQAGERAADLTRQILAYSRQQILEMRSLDLNAVITDFQNMLQRLIGETISLETRLAPSLPPIEGDKGQIEQVLLNLVINARDAMPAGGTLVLETAHILLGELESGSLPTVRPGVYVLLLIRDTGSGMETEIQERIFEPFFTTKERGQGTGLGLATVFGIIKQHGGDITVESQLEQGTTFKIYLPVSAACPSEEQDHHEITVPLYGSETVLVVEDDASVRNFVSITLESYGYRVLVADEPEQGLALAVTYDAPIHLLLTDVILPKMDGFELYSQLAQSRRELKVLYMSGYPKDVMDRHNVSPYGDGFVHKPFDSNRLLSRVRAVLRKGDASTETVR